MIDQIRKYSDKLLSDRSVVAERVAFAALDDQLIVEGDAELSGFAASVASRLGCLALIVATPSLRFSEWLLKRADSACDRLIPGDTETRTFLHDIPILRKEQMANDPAGAAVKLLGCRKGIIAEGIGIVAAGALTVEQAYVNWSSVFHSTFVKYLLDLLTEGFRLPDEEAHFRWFREAWLRELSAERLAFRAGPICDHMAILDEMASVGRYTVQSGLVDSFFGNISCRLDDTLFISQTASSLDELEGVIDQVPFDNSSTAGITASSELVAHQRIYELLDCTTILHGHPRFSVIMSMLCDKRERCGIWDCWRDCREERELGGTPVVAGEIGAGGLARNVPPVIGKTGAAIVYGHGVFSIGRTDFAEAFQRLVDVENWCRREYFHHFDQHYGRNGDRT